MIEFYIDEDVDYLDSMTGGGIGQCVGPLDTVGGITGEGSGRY